MSTPEPNTLNAARLIYKALNSNLSAINDTQYRELLDLYRAAPEFMMQVKDIAEGLELSVLDFSERGLILAPVSRESRFAYRVGDIRTNLKPEQKAALVLAHVAVASVFFPTTDGLEDDNYVPRPATVADFRDELHSLARRLNEIETLDDEIPPELGPGWAYISSLPSSIRGAQRATANSVTGLIGLALLHMKDGGLVRLDREATDEDQVSYTATHRLRVQLRELTLLRLFELAQAQQVSGAGA